MKKTIRHMSGTKNNYKKKGRQQYRMFYLLCSHIDMQCRHHCTECRLQPNPRTCSTEMKAYTYCSDAASYIMDRDIRGWNMIQFGGAMMCIHR